MTEQPMQTNDNNLSMKAMMTLDLNTPMGQCRVIPVQLGPGKPRAILAIHAADFDVDPYSEMFFFPTDHLTMVLFTVEGEILWQRDLGRGVVPGMWFCPMYPFDLDGDGVDEIWFVNNIDPQHPLGRSSYRLERVDALTGEATGQWPWPRPRESTLSHTFRNFIVGGYANEQPVLVTIQGTYGDMYFQAWNPDMTERWTYHVPADAPGARGSHRCPVVDINLDGVDELLWGERCIEMDSGKELFVADRDLYRGHSDIIQPVWDYDSKRWFIFTARESDKNVSPRVAMFDNTGKRTWGDVDQGHMDMGWTARLLDDMGFVANAIRIGHKTCGPDGRFHFDMTEFNYNALTGEPIDLPYSTYHTVPVDLNGDGYHEIIRSNDEGIVLNRHGSEIGQINGSIIMASKFCDLPGEQLLTFTKEGVLTIWADVNAEDSPAALERYADPYYNLAQRLTSSGSNLVILGGR